MKKAIIPIVIIAALVVIYLVTTSQQNAQQAQQQGDQQQVAGQGQTVNLVYVEWASETASTNVVKAVLQEKMGYDCKITPVSAAAMWKAVSTDDADGMVAAWLPTTHGHYLEDVNDSVVNLGPNLEGTRIGLVVPQYVTIDSIPQLKDNAEKFDSQIIGIDPGAGIMSTTEEAMEVYNLDNFQLVEGSGATMTGALQNAIRNNEWVVVTDWTPHWSFARWDLKYLKDPENVYGGEEYISTIVRKGLQQDMPEVYHFLDNFKWTPQQMQTVMAWNQQEDSVPYETAKKWVNENPDIVNQWIPGSSE